MTVCVTPQLATHVALSLRTTTDTLMIALTIPITQNTDVITIDTIITNIIIAAIRNLIREVSIDTAKR